MEGKSGGYQNGQTSVIKGSRIKFHPQRRVIGVAHREGPEIEVMRQDGVVQGLEIFCHCGEKIKIDFEYGSSPPAG
jgi:hypothetical protein